MKKSFLSLLSLFLILFSFSCSFNVLEEKTSGGSIAIALPGSSARAASNPTEYTIKLIHAKDTNVVELKGQAGSPVFIDDLRPGEYEISVKGVSPDSPFEFIGKTNVIVTTGKTAQALVQLERFLQPVYVSNSGDDSTGNGTAANPLKTIKAAREKYINPYDGKGTIYLNGTFNETIDLSSGNNLILAKSPLDGSTAVLDTTCPNVKNNTTLELIDISIINGAKVSIEENGTLKIGGSTNFDKDSQISIFKDASITISQPLTSSHVANLQLPPTTTKPILIANGGVSTANEYNKFSILSNENNIKALNSSGNLITNKKINLTLNNPKTGTTYKYKVKEKEATSYIIEETTYTVSGPIKSMINTAAPAPETYYFNVGKTYTVEIYETGTTEPVRSEDITVSENDSSNNVELDMNVLYVSNLGDDNNDGSSKATAFKTVGKAVTAAGEDTLIKIYGAVNIPSTVTVNKSLTLKGLENATLDSNIDQTILVNSGKTLTLENITVNGNITLGDSGAGDMIMKDGATFNSTNTISVAKGQLKMEGSAKAGIIDIQCTNGIKIIGSLTETPAGTIRVNYLKLGDLTGKTIVTASDTSLLSNNYSKFKLDGLSDNNQYMITANGNLVQNKTVALTVTNRKLNTPYTYKIKEQNTNKYLNSSDNTVGTDGSDVNYYFIVGKTYTIDIFEGSKIVGSTDVTITDGKNSASAELYKYYVKSNGSDTANGFSVTNAFRTINRAVTAIGSTSDKYTINIVDSLTDSTPVVLDKNGPTDLTIIGEATTRPQDAPITILSGNNFTLKNNNKLTLKNIKCTGTTTLNNAAILKLDGSIEAGNITLNDSDTYVETLSRIYTQNYSSPYIATLTVPESKLTDGTRVLICHDPKGTNYKDFNTTFNKTLDNIEFDIDYEGRIAPVQIQNIDRIIERIHTQSSTISELNMRVSFETEDDFATLGGQNALKQGNTLLNITIVPKKTITITTVAKGACKDYTNLKSITLPKSITSIGAEAFNGCTSLTSVIFEETGRKWTAGTETNIDVSTPTDNATNLTTTHNLDTWTRQ